MKQRVLYGILAAEAAVCVVLYATQASFAGAFPTVIAFPFEQIGFGLRALSLSGGPGNVAAFILYAVFCLSPAAMLLPLRKKRRLCGEDWLLALLNAVLFAVVYFMVNPGLIGAPLGGGAGADGLPIGKAMLGGIVYSILCGYFVLRLLRLFFFSSNKKLAGYMAVFLSLLAAVFVYLIFGACFGTLLDSVQTLQAGNSWSLDVVNGGSISPGHESLPVAAPAFFGPDPTLAPSYIFVVLKFIVNALPYALDIAIALTAIRLLDALRADRYSAESLAAAGRLSRLCATALVVTVLSNIGFNLLQALFAASIPDMHVSVEIPVLSIAFVLAALLLTRLVADNKRLKDDNDMFI
jgi:hypothetical protein